MDLRGWRLPDAAVRSGLSARQFRCGQRGESPSAISTRGPSIGDTGAFRPHVHGTYSLSPEGAFGGRLRLSPELAAEIGEVNVAINRAIKPRTDMEAFGIDNYWTLPLSDGPRAEGNCKHYALEKRRRLIDDGVPSNALPRHRRDPPKRSPCRAGRVHRSRRRGHGQFDRRSSGLAANRLSLARASNAGGPTPLG